MSSDSCLNCKRFSKCSYEGKSRNYKCGKWKSVKIDNTLDISSVFAQDRDFSFSTSDGPTKKILTDSELKRAEINLTKMMDEVFDSSSPFPKDLKIDDRDLPEFKNFYDFCYHKEYGLINSKIKPFSRQMWIGVKLFADYCPHCTKGKFMDDIENIPVDYNARQFKEDVQLLEYGVCPKCKRGRSEFVKKKLLNFYRELAACIGQRAGKSITFSFLEAYVIHKFLKMQKPSEVLTGLPNVTLTATYTATDFKTAMETLWQPLTDIISDSVWFAEYHKLLAHYGNKFGEETYKFMDTFVHYKHRKLFLSAAAPNKRNLRGRTRFSFGIDELGWFDASQESKDKTRISADEIHGALDRSMQTVRSAAKLLLKRGYNNITAPMAVNISSPSSQQDKIMTMVRKNVDSRIVLAVHLPTWEFNPKEPRSNFKQSFIDDPVKAERDFGANPPMTDSPFIEDQDMVEKCFKAGPNRAQYEYKYKKDESKKLLDHYAVANFVAGRDIVASVMAIDGGYTNNSFALKIGHRKDKDIVFDVIVEIAPELGKTALNYALIYENIMVPAIKAFNVKAVFADRWNSLFLLQKIREDYNIIAEQYSVKYSDFTLFKSFMEGGRIIFPRLEMKAKDCLIFNGEDYPHYFKYKSSSHLYMQCLTVSDTGKTVTKGTNRTDDIFRASVLAGKYLLDDEWCKEHLKDVKKNTNTCLVALGEGSGGGGVVSTATGKGVAALGGSGGGGNVFTRQR